LKASIVLHIDRLAVYLCNFIYKKLKNSEDLDEIVFMLNSLPSLNLYYQQKIESLLESRAVKIYRDSCERAEVLADQEIINSHHRPAISVLLIKLNQLDPIKVLMHPYFNKAIDSSRTPQCGDFSVRSYYYSVILKNRPIIATQSHWRPESKIAVSKQIGNVTLVANDQKEFTIARSTAEFSETIKNMIEVVGTSNPIPFKDINSCQLSLIIESLKKIEEIAQTQSLIFFLKSDKIIDLDRLFIGKSYADVIEILKAVNYLDIPLLLEYINILIVKQLHFSDIINVAALCTSLENNLPSELRLLIVGMMKKFYKEEIEQFLSKPVKTIMYNAQYCDCVDMVSFALEDKCVLIKMNETSKGWDEKKLYLFDTATSNVVTKISGTSYLNDKDEERVALNKKGTLCLAGRRKLCLWDLKTGKKISEYSGKKVPTLSIAISPDDTYALTGLKSGLVYLRKLFTGEIVKSLKGPNSEVKSMHLSTIANRH
jgi:hypothetical protein